MSSNLMQRLKAFLVPKDRKAIGGLQRFLGIAGFYCWMFGKNFSSIAQPLTNLL